jgi:transcriptional regulator GlxA family with amidase domain
MATGAPPPAPGPAARVVAAVIGEGALTFDLAVPCEVFGLDRSDLGVAWYRFLLVSADPSPITTSTGFQLATPHRLDALAEAGTVVVPGWCDPEVRPSAELVAALTAAHRAGARIVSLCTGAFVLADAGLLDGRRATTHWMYAERLRARCAARVDPAALYVQDGNVFTSAGTAAGIDLCLHLVRLDHGAEIANAVARRLVMPPFREGGQAQYIDRPLPVDPADQAFGDLLRWAADHLDEGVTVDDLARRAAMSTRTLGRRFRGALGLSPSEWLLGERIRLAQRILETTGVPLEVVAARAGFGSAATMRSVFARRLRTSPRAYRRTFRAATPAGRSPEP